jgi:hypothetical protein
MINSTQSLPDYPSCHEGTLRLADKCAAQTTCTCDYVPRPWINLHSPESPRSLAERHFLVVKSLRSGFAKTGELLATATPDILFAKLAPIPPHRHTSAFTAVGEVKTARQELPSTYPPTNGNAGGKLPTGKCGSGSPFWSFSAAVR